MRNLLKKGKAAVLVERDRIEIREYAILKVGDGDILVKIELAGVCGTDVHLWHSEKTTTPMIMGHENIGRIVEMGERVETDTAGNKLSEGDLVTWTPSYPCGKCYYCKIEQETTSCINRKVYGIAWSSEEPPHFRGGFAEYAYLSEGTAVFKIPEGVPIERVVTLGCGLPTVVHGIERAGNIGIGESVVIQGAGPVGLAALLLAKSSYAFQVIVIDGVEKRLKIAKDMGADHLVDMNVHKDEKDRVNRVLELTNGRGADLVIEASGALTAVQEGLQMVRDAGRYLVIGQYVDRGPTLINPYLITGKQIKVIGSKGFTPRHTYKALKFIETLEYPLEKLITRKFRLEDTEEALKAVERRKVVKAVVSP